MKLTNARLEEIFDEMALPAEGRAFVREMRSRPPDRDPNTSIAKTGRIASRKMGHAVRSESESGEVVAINEYEFDEDVVEFWDQVAVTVPYAPAGTDHKAITHTIDFIIIRRANGHYRIDAEEWRTPERMRKLARADGERYKELEDGDWTQVPVEQWLAQRGFKYRIRMVGSIPPLRARNYELLRDYRIAPHPLSGDIAERVLDTVTRQPAVSLAEVLRTVAGATVDDVFALIAQGSLKANLDATLLTEHDKVHLYEEGPVTQMLRTADSYADRGEVRLEPGARVRMFDKELHILSITAEHVHLNGDRYEKLRVEDFNRLIAEGHVVGLVDTRADAINLLLKYSIDAQDQARQRVEVLRPFIDAGGYPESRTQQRWLAAYRQAEIDYGAGNGVLGLLPGKGDRGNYDPRLGDDQEEAAADAIRRFYLNPDQMTKQDAFAMHQVDCRAKGIEPVSRATFYRRLNAYRLDEIAHARWGKRAAYAAAPRSHCSGGVMAHGEHAQSRIDIDHSPCDVETVDAVSGENLGIPSVTLSVDPQYRYVTGVSVLYEKPSARSDMLALREHVRNTGRLPTSVWTDNGTDFHSKQFQGFLTARGSSLKYRRSGDARDGAGVEGTLLELMRDVFWKLQGNVKSLKDDPRKLDRANSPTARAIYTIGELQAMVDKWRELHNEKVIPTLGGSPRQLVERDLARAGSRPGKAQPYSVGFRALTALPPEHGRHVKVGRDGVTVNNLQYWSDAFLLPGVMGTKVEVRYEPFDARTAYALVGKVWHELNARYPELEGRSDKEIKALSQQLRQRLKRVPSPRELAEYIYALKIAEPAKTAEQLERVKRREQFAVLDAKEREAIASATEKDRPAERDDERADEHVEDRHGDRDEAPQPGANPQPRTEDTESAPTAADTADAVRVYDMPTEDEIAELQAQLRATDGAEAA